MEGNGCVESQERISRIYESLLLVRLGNENPKPHVKGSEESDRPQKCLRISSTRPENRLEGQQWCCKHSENKPNVEVKQEVSNVERPWFRSKNLRALSFSPKDIVSNNVPRHNGELLEEDIVDGNFKGLELVSMELTIFFNEGKKHTRIDRHRKVPSTTLKNTFFKEPKIKPMTNSSSRSGIIRAPAKGQPTMAPNPNHMIPCAVFCPPLQSKKADRPNMDMYMVKLDGRKAVEAWNMPGLNATIIRNRSPILGLRVRQMAEYSLVSQEAHTTAKTNRTT